MSAHLLQVCRFAPLTRFFCPPPVASWISYVSFMRWGFEGMLQVQFKGNKYPVTIFNDSIDVDGTHVSRNRYNRASVPAQCHTIILLFLQVVEAMNMNQYPLYSCYLVLLGVCLGFLVLYFISLKFIKQKSSQDW